MAPGAENSSGFSSSGTRYMAYVDCGLEKVKMLLLKPGCGYRKRRCLLICCIFYYLKFTAFWSRYAYDLLQLVVFSSWCQVYAAGELRRSVVKRKKRYINAFYCFSIISRRQFSLGWQIEILTVRSKHCMQTVLLNNCISALHEKIAMRCSLCQF